MLDMPKPTRLGRCPLTACRGLAWIVLGVLLLGGCGSSETPDDAETSAAKEKASGNGQDAVGGETAPQPVAPGSTTAEDVLKRMVTAYKTATSYSDQGTVRLVADRSPDPVDETLNYAVALTRPNKLRLDVYTARVVADGEKLYAALTDLADQVAVRKSPAELTVQSIYADRIIAMVLNGGRVGRPLQLHLLLGSDPARDILAEAQQLTLGEPEAVSGHDCYRVHVQRPEGTFVCWVDQQTFALRRINYPVDSRLRELLARNGTVKDISLVAEFTGAQFDSPIDPAAFQFEVPAGVETHEWLRGPHPAQLLGKQIPAYGFFGADGKEITSQSLTGKIVVVNFWADGWAPSADQLPKFEEVRRRFQGNEKIVWLAVSVNEPDVENATLQEALGKLGVRLPVVRDPQRNQATVFSTLAVPSTFIIDGRGVLQDIDLGDNPQLTTVLPEKLGKVLAGEDIFQAPLAAYEKQLAAAEEGMRTAAESPMQPAAGGQQTIPLAQAEVAEASQPETLKLTKLWTYTELPAPGNVLVVTSPGKPPRVLVVDTFKSVAEIGMDGRLVANHALDIDQMDFISTLRTATAGDGTRLFLALHPGRQRCHVLDESLELLLSYPESALESPHAGMADARLADLDGDGTLELYTGYWGVLGVRAASLQGKSLWSNRSDVRNVQQMAVGGPGQQGQRRLFCVDTSDRLTVLDATGRLQGYLPLRGRHLRKVAAADLDGDGRLEWCGMSGLKQGENVAIGFDLEGKELWSYTLPEGIHELPIERIIPANLTPGGEGQWLLPGPDGSIHILTAAGKPIDRFNYGKTLAGLASAVIDGKPVLIVASSEGVEALAVE